MARFAPVCALIPFFFFLCGAAHAAPGDILYSEDFDNGTGGWIQTAGANGSFGVNNALTATNAAYVAGDSVVRAVSPAADLSSVPGARVTLTVIRGKQTTQGGKTVSNRPELDENFYLDYLDDRGNWITINTQYGGGQAGEVLPVAVDLPVGALHAGFQLRASTVGGDAWDGDPDDFWHFDDVVVIETADAAGNLDDCDLADDFESGGGNWSFTGNAAIVGTTFNSATRSLDVVGDSSATMATVLDLSGKTAKLRAWVRAGGWAGGPDGPTGPAEMLVFEYQRSNGQWRTLLEVCECQGDGDINVDDGGVAMIEVELPNAALHSATRIRIRQPAHDSTTADHWFVDDVCIAATSPFHHFAIAHDGNAVNCQPEIVDIVAHAADHSTATDYAGAVVLSTSTSHGDWNKAVAAGTLVNNGNGSASYTFVSADKGKATLKLANTFVEQLNINAFDNPASEDAGEDPDLVFGKTGFQFLDANTGLAPGVQIAGKPSNAAPSNPIELQAIRTNDSTGACEAAFVDATAVDIAMSCEVPGTCASASGVVNGIPVATGNAGTPGSWTTLNLDFGDNTDSTAPLVFQYDEAGKVKLHVRKVLSPSGEIMAGSSSFVVRPFGLHVSADQGAITNTNPGASNPAGDGFERAGEPFRVTVRAVGWQVGDDNDGNGIPDGHGDTDPANNADLSDNVSLENFAVEASPDGVALSATLVSPPGGDNVALAGATTVSGFSSGVANSADVRWSEVGVMEIDASLEDGDYQGAGDIVGRSGYVGRFLPHHLTTAVNNHGCSDADGFTYSSQPLARFSVTARAAGGNVTKNFSWNGSSGFARDITLVDPAASPPGSFNGGIGKEDFSGGVAQVDNHPVLNDGVSYTFSAENTAPYSLTIRALDDEGTSSAGFAEGQTEVRSARLRLGRAAAPAHLDARAPLVVETWDGSGWFIETTDTCTTYGSSVDDEVRLADMSYLYRSGNLSSPEGQASDGKVETGEGYVLFTAPGFGKQGVITATLDVPAWLEFNGEDPAAQVEFVDKHAGERTVIRTGEIVGQ